MRNFLYQFKNSKFIRFITLLILSSIFLGLSNFYEPLKYISIVLCIYPAIYILTMFIYAWVINPIRDRKPAFGENFDKFIDKWL